jgi:hypothetical protein
MKRETPKRVPHVIGSVALFCSALVLAAPGPAQAQDAASLLHKHETLQPQLSRSPFGRPLVLQSNAAADEPRGEAYALLRHPFSKVADALQRGEHWCDVLVLQSNMKRCAVVGEGAQQQLRVAIGRKFEQPVEQAYQVDFNYAVRAARSDYLQVQMAAASGPMGTRDYRLTMEAVPVGAGQTFIHMSYSYAAGFAARMATDAYLATAGRSKVGFSVAGRDAEGKPVYVDGIRGVAERNTMRYFLAIDAFLNAMSLPPEQQAEGRLRNWFAATEKYPRQLKEMELDEYLAMKRRELKLSAAPRPSAG